MTYVLMLRMRFSKWGLLVPEGCGERAGGCNALPSAFAAAPCDLFLRRVLIHGLEFMFHERDRPGSGDIAVCIRVLILEIRLEIVAGGDFGKCVGDRLQPLRGGAFFQDYRTELVDDDRVAEFLAGGHVLECRE